MIDVCNHFELDSITTHLAINNLDKIQPHSKFSRFEWQFLAIANILIASKYNENEEYTPPFQNLEEITQQKITNETVLQYELFVLKNSSITKKKILYFFFIKLVPIAIGSFPPPAIIPMLLINKFCYSSFVRFF